MGMAEMRFVLYQGDAVKALKKIPDESVDCVVTSPPYWGLRDYQVDGQIGLEQSPEEYVFKLVEVFREVRRVLKNSGTCWLNLGDSYMGSGQNSGKKEGMTAGGKHGIDTRSVGIAPGVHSKPPTMIKHKSIKPKDLVGIPWRVAFALQADGWWLRQDIIWAKPNPMPESVTDRCTKSHEYIFLLSKSQKYYFDNEATMEIATGYDGRKDTKYKGGQKDMSGGAHERWKFKNLQEKGQPPNTIHLNRLNNVKDGTEYLTPVRNKRSVWTITTKPYAEAHFATFPPELPELCIKAGCPEYICFKCGMPRVKIIENGRMIGTGGSDKGKLSENKDTNLRNDNKKLFQFEKIIKGYSDCGCNAGFKEGVVLDPFLGSGTTLMVARELGRSGIGIELNPEYVKLAKKRVGWNCGLDVQFKEEKCI